MVISYNSWGKIRNLLFNFKNTSHHNLALVLLYGPLMSPLEIWQLWIDFSLVESYTMTRTVCGMYKWTKIQTRNARRAIQWLLPTAHARNRQQRLLVCKLLARCIRKIQIWFASAWCYLTLTCYKNLAYCLAGHGSATTSELSEHTQTIAMIKRLCRRVCRKPIVARLSDSQSSLTLLLLKSVGVWETNNKKHAHQSVVVSK